MKAEHVEKLKVRGKHRDWDKPLSEEKNKENGKRYFAPVDILCESTEQSVLEASLGLVTSENEQYGGV
jgi:hypothetical protein